MSRKFLQFRKKIKTKHAYACNLNKVIREMKHKENEIVHLESKLENNSDEKFLKKLLQEDNKALQT